MTATPEQIAKQLESLTKSAEQRWENLQALRFITINGGRYTLNLASVGYIDWQKGDYGVIYNCHYDPSQDDRLVDFVYFLNKDDVANVQKAVGLQ
jgi:hypothetical protein